MKSCCTSEILHGPLIPIKIIVQFFECRIPERVLLNGAISICRRFSKVSHQFEAMLCSLSFLAIFTFWVYTLWHTTLILYSKQKSSITAPGPLTLKLISKQARLNATKSVLVLLQIVQQTVGNEDYFFCNTYFLFFSFYRQVPCKQWFLQAGHYATKGEKPLRASVCFIDRATVQRYGRIN